MLPRKWFLFVTLALLIAPFASLSAQNQPTISIALSAVMQNVIDESIFDDFENANGVSVYVNYVDPQVPPASAGIDTYLDGIAEYASAADVLYVTDTELTLEATRAGYLLDLSPLTSTDSTLYPDDFIPVTWNSVQWDNGVWGLPISVDATMMMYDPAAFDQAGLAYPSDRWTLDDLAIAARALTQYDANGNVSTPGLSTFGSTDALFRSLYGQNFYDDSGNPRFTDPALEDLLTQWQELVDEGVVGSTFIGGGSNEVPLRIMGSFGLRIGGGPNANNSNPPVALALPGGRVGMSMNTLAVSSGTQQPELAYALAKYLTNNPSMANGIFGGIPARQSLAGVQAQQDNGGPGNGGPGGGGGEAGFAFAAGVSADVQAALDQLLPSALTLSEQRYADYINGALNAMSESDAHTALQDAEAQAMSDLQAAADRRSSVSVVVATPPPPVVLQPGEIALNFGVQSFIQPIPNLDEWKQLAADFSANDPDVGDVNFDTQGGNASTLAASNDCFYLTSNAVPNLDETVIINLDPYLDTDPNFDPRDVVGGLMTQLQKDNRTWAYPMTIQPQTLSYNATIFQQAGVPLPTNGWTLDQFLDALRTLKDYLNKEPFVSRDINGESLMMLIAAYGGLPVDYRTTPATLNFTDPATVDAIQQVLDLAKNGYIDYQALVTGTGGFRIVAIGADEETAITSDSLAGFRRFIGGGPGGGSDSRLVSYPTGVYTGASFTIGTGYISATAQNPDACYRWLSYVAQHVDIFGAMPARLSQITDPAMQANYGDNAGFYADYARILAEPTTVVFPSAAGGNSAVRDFLLQFWLNRAFDNYVLNNADLAAELADAQTYSNAYLECVSALPPSETTGGGGGPGGFNSGVLDCARSADPSISSLIPGGG
ncbi:MAG: extracellular solute-binding protein [Anaerolineae bacterium]|nr:extracellular solute-binding protein [Anaerolineae bacterium]